MNQIPAISLRTPKAMFQLCFLGENPLPFHGTPFPYQSRLGSQVPLCKKSLGKMTMIIIDA